MCVVCSCLQIDCHSFNVKLNKCEKLQYLWHNVKLYSPNLISIQKEPQIYLDLLYLVLLLFAQEISTHTILFKGSCLHVTLEGDYALNKSHFLCLLFRQNLPIKHSQFWVNAV